jgi:OFA family oxalate/formate antiporter-like MFS transporter
MKEANRYHVLAAGMAIQLCAGIIYMWSVFRGPVAAHLGWGAADAALTSSVMLAMFVLGIIVGGRAQDKLGPKRVTLAGSAMIGLGMALTALAAPSAPWVVYITYGIVGGFGVGTVYTATVAAVQKWFPDRRGFASGMIVSAFGFSLVLFAPLARAMLNGLGVDTTFLVFGLGFLCVCGLCSLLVQNPPEGWLPRGYTPTQAVANRRQYAPREILATRQYWLLAGGLLFTLPAYFILNPVFLSLGAERGLSEGLALLGVSLTGISSAAGRLFVSWVSDKIGRKAAMAGVALLILAASLVMIAGKSLLFLACIMLISFGFGGSSSVYAAMTAESFGTKYGGMNFGLVMLGFGVSALMFPIISNRLTADGSYASSFILAAATCGIAMILVLLMDNPSKKTIQ